MGKDFLSFAAVSQTAEEECFFFSFLSFIFFSELSELAEVQSHTCQGQGGGRQAVGDVAVARCAVRAVNTPQVEDVFRYSG